MKLTTDHLLTDTKQQDMIAPWLREKNLDEDENKYEIHKDCFKQIEEEVANIEETKRFSDIDPILQPSSVEENVGTSEQGSTETQSQPLLSYDRKTLIYQLLIEVITAHTSDNIPAHVPTIMKDLEESFDEYTEAPNSLS